MNFDTVKLLISKGLSLQEVLELYELETNKEKPAEPEEKEPVTIKETVTPEEETAVSRMLEAVNRLTETIQYSNMLNNTIDTPKERTIDDITKDIIQRDFNKKG
jgi:predicted RNase H-like nuclease (RuvC/YqgF family)